jgi:uncharacterized protein (TIGR02118 family)
VNGYVKRKTRIAVEVFQDYWINRHGPLTAKIPGIRRYIQSHTRPSGYRRPQPPAYDGLASTWFDCIDAMQEAEASAEWAEAEAGFIPMAFSVSGIL